MKEEEPASEPLVVRRRSPLPFLAVVAALVLGGAGLAWYLATRPDPFKIVVAVDLEGPWWDGSAPAEAVAEEVGDGLDKIGFEVVKTTDRAAISALAAAATPRDAARALGAGFVLSADVKREVIEHPIEGGYFELRAEVTLRVQHVAEDRAEEQTFTSWAAGVTREDAMKILREQIANRAFDAALPRLTGHPVIREKLERGDVGALVRLDAAKRFVETRQRQVEEAAAADAKVLADRQAAPADPAPITYHGTFSGVDYLGGTGAKGALVNRQGRRPFYHPKRARLEWLNDLETVSWRAPDGGEEVLWSGYHVLGYPAVAPEGSPVLLVEDLFGGAKTLTVIDAGAEPRRVLVHKSARFDNPEVAPGGAHAAMYVRLCYGCSRDLAVLSLKDGVTAFRRASGSEDEGYGGYAWLDARRVAYVVAPGAEGIDGRASEELRVVDVGSVPATDALLVSLGEDRCAGPSASADGRHVVMMCAGPTTGSRLVLFDTTDGKRTEAGVAGAAPALSRDGKRVAYTRGADVFVLTWEGLTEKRRTRNEFVERNVQFSADGARVYFESQAEDPNLKTRTVGVVASVPAD